MTSRDWTIVAVTGGVTLALLVVGPIVQFALQRRDRTAVAADLRLARWPTRAVAAAVVLAGAGEVSEQAGLTEAARATSIVAVAWLVITGLLVVQGVVFRRLDIARADNLLARSRRTQIELARRVVGVIVIVGTIVVLVLAFTPLGGIGETIVAYAGVIGILLGFALRTPIENLAAGMIIAFSEPIRIDDVVVVEGEWGRVEHIGLVNVSVRIWDDRRLVLPTSRFVNEPFENWTRQSAEVTGAVTAWIDFTADVGLLRDEIAGALRSSALWDRRHFGLQVVELGEQAMRVRALVTARNAADLWDLRCELREALLPHLASRADALPVVRVTGALSAERDRRLAAGASRAC